MARRIEYKSLQLLIGARSFSSVEIGDTVVMRPSDFDFLHSLIYKNQNENIIKRAKVLGCGAFLTSMPDGTIEIHFLPYPQAFGNCND